MKAASDQQPAAFQTMLFGESPKAPQMRAGTHTCTICGKRWNCVFPGLKADCPRVTDPRCPKCS
jgi:hypothetical protein